MVKCQFVNLSCWEVASGHKRLAVANSLEGDLYIATTEHGGKNKKNITRNSGIIKCTGIINNGGIVPWNGLGGRAVLTCLGVPL